MSSQVVGIDSGGRRVSAIELRNLGATKPTITRFHELALTADAGRRGDVGEVSTVVAAIKKV